MTQTCLRIYQDTLLGTSLYNSTCSTSQSASLILGITEVNGTTYNAKSYVNFGDAEQFFDGLSHSFDEENKTGTSIHFQDQNK